MALALCSSQCQNHCEILLERRKSLFLHSELNKLPRCIRWFAGDAQEDEHAGYQHHRQRGTQRRPLERQRAWLPPSTLPEQLSRKVPISGDPATTSNSSPILRRPSSWKETVGTHGIPRTTETLPVSSAHHSTVRGVGPRS